MGVRVERIDLDLLLELRDGIVIALHRLVCQSEIVVGKFVVRIDFDLLLEGVGRLLVLIGREIGAAKTVPQAFVFGVGLSNALEQVYGQREVVVARGLHGRIEKIVR